MTLPAVVFRALKSAAVGVALCLVVPCAAMCWVEQALNPEAEGTFNFWSHVMAIMPGAPGVCLRRAFYRLTLASCSLSLTVGFGAFFAHRDAYVEEDIYIGPFAVIGRVRLRKGSLVGTRASLLSGSTQHDWDEAGRLTPSTMETLHQIEIGPHSWIGEAAVVMATVGEGALVSAGAVVSAPVPPGVVVAGNPARFVRRVKAEAGRAEVAELKERGHEPLVHAGH